MRMCLCDLCGSRDTQLIEPFFLSVTTLSEKRTSCCPISALKYLYHTPYIYIYRRAVLNECRKLDFFFAPKKSTQHIEFNKQTNNCAKLFFAEQDIYVYMEGALKCQKT